MKNWYENSVKALQLNGKGERTQQSYTSAVRMLTEFCGKTPDRISEEELQEYFLHRKNVNKWSPNTMRICYCGIRFFFEIDLVSSRSFYFDRNCLSPRTQAKCNEMPAQAPTDTRVFIDAEAPKRATNAV